MAFGSPRRRSYSRSCWTCPSVAQGHVSQSFPGAFATNLRGQYLAPAWAAAEDVDVWVLPSEDARVGDHPQLGHAIVAAREAALLVGVIRNLGAESERTQAPRRMTQHEARMCQAFTTS
eukprot:scaffold7494_cov439-Pinguiococcus_pyrenoidosus.AAC.1